LSSSWHNARTAPILIAVDSVDRPDLDRATIGRDKRSGGRAGRAGGRSRSSGVPIKKSERATRVSLVGPKDLDIGKSSSWRDFRLLARGLIRAALRSASRAEMVTQRFTRFVLEYIAHFGFPVRDRGKTP
jgi:hypothetical protein